MSRRVTTGILLLELALAGPPVATAVGQEAAVSAGDTDGVAASNSNVVTVDGAAATSESTSESAAVSNQRKRNAIILAMLVAGIALTGLLLLIAAIVARGFLRKMAVQSEAKRRAELALPPDVAAAAAEAAADVDESIPISERETEVT